MTCLWSFLDRLCCDHRHSPLPPGAHLMEGRVSRTQVEMVYLIPSSPESQAQVLGLHCGLGTPPVALPKVRCFLCRWHDLEAEPRSPCCDSLTSVHPQTYTEAFPSIGAPSIRRCAMSPGLGRVPSCPCPKQSWQPFHAHRVQVLCSLWLRPLWWREVPRAVVLLPRCTECPASPSLGP